MMPSLAGVLLVASGFAALGYQVVWVRFLTLTLGASTEAVSTVVAAFFLGLAVGSAAAPRVLGRRHPLRVFGALEGAIGLLGVALAWVLPNLPALAAVLPVDSVAGRFAAATLLLILPTACMGATFPVLAAAVVAGSNDPGREIGRLYAANTVGASLGAVLTGFALVPFLGLGGTAFLLGGVNALAATGALIASRGRPVPVPAPDAGPLPPSPDPGDRAAALGVLVVTGSVALATEVAWTKVLVLFTGATVYGFATILAVFLSGLAAGAGAARRFPVPPGRARIRLAVVLAALGFALLATRAGLTLLPHAFDLLRAAPGSAAVRLALHFAVVAVLLLPPTLLLGACFPLALAVFCGSAARARLGPAYAANTVAGVAGSLGAGFWWIPSFGSDAVLAGAAAAVLVAAVALVAGRPGRARLGIGAAVAAGLLVAALGPSLRFEPLLASVRYEFDADSAREPRFLYLREGRTGIVSAVTYDGKSVRIQNNGLNESIVSLENPRVGSTTETLLALVPWALQDSPRRCFVVGYGGGVTVRALLDAGVPFVRVAELEPMIVDAVSTVLGPVAGLDDPRLDLLLDDARHRLLRDQDRYDIVVSQPSHPWLSGTSALFTREFFTLVRSRLDDDGVFAQWINLFNMDVATLGSLTRTFFDTFPHGFILSFPKRGDLILVGGPSPLRMARSDADLAGAGPELRGLLDACRIERASDILGHFAWSRATAMTWAGRMPANTDRNILSEVRLAALHLRSGPLPSAQDPYLLLDESASFDLASVFGPDAVPELLRELAARFVRRDERPRARRIVPVLAAFDPALADSLNDQLDGRARPATGITP